MLDRRVSLFLLAAALVACSGDDDDGADKGAPVGGPQAQAPDRSAAGEAGAPGTEQGQHAGEWPFAVTIPTTNERVEGVVDAAGVPHVTRTPARLRLVMEQTLATTNQGFLPGATLTEKCGVYLDEDMGSLIYRDVAAYQWGIFTVDLEYGPQSVELRQLIDAEVTRLGRPKAPLGPVEWPTPLIFEVDVRFGEQAVSPALLTDQDPPSTLGDLERKNLSTMLDGFKTFAAGSYGPSTGFFCDLVNGQATLNLRIAGPAPIAIDVVR